MLKCISITGHAKTDRGWQRLRSVIVVPVWISLASGVKERCYQEMRKFTCAQKDHVYMRQKKKEGGGDYIDVAVLCMVPSPSKSPCHTLESVLVTQFSNC